MLENPKILVATPTYEVMKYCEKEFLESIKNFDYDNYDILIVDNSKEEDYFNHLKEDEDITVLRVTEGKNNMLRLINSRNKILGYALENNYDYVFMLDCDVICPKDSLKKLVNANKDIISGLYFGLFSLSGERKWLPIAYKGITPEEFESMKEQVNFPKSVKSHNDLKRRLDPEELDSKKVISVLFPSGGCVLIKKNVFTKVKYSLLDTSKYGGIKTDDGIGFFTNCNNAGFPSFCDTSLVCNHLIEGKFRVDEKGVKHHPMYD